MTHIFLKLFFATCFVATLTSLNALAYSSDECKQDCIEMKVNRILDPNDRLDNELDVEIKSNEVILEGKVNSYSKKEQIETLFSNNIKDTIIIDNNIKVEPSHETDLVAENIKKVDKYYNADRDDDIALEIKERFLFSPNLDLDDMNVEVHDGTAYVSGYVDKADDRELAEKIAMKSGALDYKCNISVMH